MAVRGGNLLAGEDGRRSEVRAQTAGLHREWEVARCGATDRFVSLKGSALWRHFTGVWGESPGEWGAAHVVAAGESPFPVCLEFQVLLNNIGQMEAALRVYSWKGILNESSIAEEIKSRQHARRLGPFCSPDKKGIVTWVRPVWQGNRKIRREADPGIRARS